jgi:molecular chaperone DnaJ
MTCKTCKGKILQPGVSNKKCSICQGTGYITIRQGIMALQSICNGCQGTGNHNIKYCQTC